MHYLDEGEGEPLVLVHGNPTWSFLYRHLIKRLRHSYRCLAIDHIGFGLSDKPEAWSYLPEDHARNLEGFIEALDLHGITLVVHDWGGPIGLAYAIKYPDRVRRLVLLNTWMWPVETEWRFSLFARLCGSRLGRFLIRRFNLFARAILPLVFGDRTRLTQAIHQHYIQPLDQPEKRKGCWVFPAQFIGSSSWLHSLWAHRDQLLGKPVLILWGMRDWGFQERELETWTQLFTGAEVHRFKRAGHFLPEEENTEWVRLIAGFLTTT